MLPRPPRIKEVDKPKVNAADRENSPPIIEWSILLLIVYSIITMVLESIPEMKPYASFFDWSETIVVVIFTVEYLTFWILSPNKRRYPFQFLHVIDLLAILPFYLTAGLDLRAFRSLRLLRVFRILKFARYSQSIQLLGKIFTRVAPDLVICLIIAAMVILISSCGIYYAEHETQPDVFTSIPEALWWSIVTLTTVGYGDAVPITALGRLFAGVLMFTGIGLVAFPTSFITTAIGEIRQEARSESETAHR
jgi:voltage-gated potassium channel